jgi:hypothetical protein
LSSTTILTPIDGTKVVLKFDSDNFDDTDDLNFIKKVRTLFVSDETTFVSLTSNFISDMQGNAIDQIETTDAQKVKSYKNDDTNPTLREFDLDMTEHTLTLRFSETVKATDTLNIESFTLKGASGQSFVPRGIPIISEDSTEIVVLLTTNDINEIKKTRPARSFGGNNCT